MLYCIHPSIVRLYQLTSACSLVRKKVNKKINWNLVFLIIDKSDLYRILWVSVTKRQSPRWAICGFRPMFVRTGETGIFSKCTNHPDCQHLQQNFKQTNECLTFSLILVPTATAQSSILLLKIKIWLFKINRTLDHWSGLERWLTVKQLFILTLLLVYCQSPVLPPSRTWAP